MITGAGKKWDGAGVSRPKAKRKKQNKTVKGLKLSKVELASSSLKDIIRVLIFISFAILLTVALLSLTLKPES